ncbi:MAG: hypothetical protein JXA97_11470 [Anaerolineales bacterium]|nr:hypothetical protein [Anaerolineales bacterium]
MKRAVSVSIGSSTRDNEAVVNLLGQEVQIQRIGTDGDMEAAAQLYRELDGKVDAFGVGGTDLGLQVDDHWYRLHSVSSMTRFIEKTPVVDGGGLKMTLEHGLAQFVDEHLGDQINPRTALVTSAADRWGMAASFFDAGYETICGDLMFAINLPIPLRSKQSLKNVARLVVPIFSRLPFEWLYPTGDEQHERTPRWEKYYQWASIIAGDCHFVRKYMPDRLDGKIIVTNTTTKQDREIFREAGVSYVVTSTPVIEGRSYGTNMMEAALVAAAGKQRPLKQAELQEIIQTLDIKPQLHKLQ